MEWFLLAADQGHGAPQDYTKAMEWFLKTADQRDAGAQLEIDLLYKKDHTVFQDYIIAAA
ncbi:hypothetical protein BGX23_012592 [Mortierella sp. AD031]|nr:hypothetical protein BGX23_012592 [Mortierella sp. AD031]KAG0204976.1 hypothetical protein BGX33_008174 [Mortierella sp. NVP41]